MLSGDDTCLKNVWEEYCVDQQEGTNYSDVYLQTVEAHIESYLEECSQHERMLLYLTTDSAESQMEELEAESGTKELDSTKIAIDLQAIIDFIRWDLEEAAKEFTNSNIEKSLYGENDEEGEENNEEENDEEEEFDQEEITVPILPKSIEQIPSVDSIKPSTSIHSIPGQTQPEINQNIDPARLHMMQKMNFIDSRHNRPPSYPGVVVPANFSYYTNEQMDYLIAEKKRKQS